MVRWLLIIITAILISGCQSIPKQEDPRLAVTKTQQKFKEIPALDGKVITIAVYNFADKTGQRKPNDKFAPLSSAVTQGAEVWVIKSLKEVGNGTWFQVLERTALDNLIKERQLIRSTREQYANEKDKKLKPLLFAGLLVEGGIVGYDSNVQTGGAGARYLGIGPYTQYRVDVVTVAMRVVSVSTGEVLLTIATEKTILSTSLGQTVFKFLDMGTKALEIESAQTENEPVNYAVRSAIEQGVVEIILEGQRKGLWKFKENKETK